MPAIQGQQLSILSATHATLSLLADRGTLLIDVLQAGTTVTITGSWNGVQTNQVVLSNPPAATVEAQVDAAVAAMIGGVQFRSHLVSNSPLAIQIGIWNLGASVPANWWN